MALVAPAIEVATDSDAFGVGRPNGEINPFFAFMLHDMAAHLFIEAKVFARVK
jgi:hypothetical protein